MRLTNQSKLSPEAISEIEREVPDQENLQHLMAWALTDPESFIPRVVAAVIVQDEFTHDVVVPWRNGLVLVYDTT